MQICTKMHDFLCKNYPNFPVVIQYSGYPWWERHLQGQAPQSPVPQTQVIPARPPNVKHKSAPMRVRVSQRFSNSVGDMVRFSVSIWELWFIAWLAICSLYVVLGMCIDCSL